MVSNLSAAEYEDRLEKGWRRFGAMMFHPQCPACQACQPIRVEVLKFAPSRSQIRAARKNQDDIEVRIGPPKISRARLDLYDRFHAFHADFKGWPEHPPKDAASYRESYVHNPAFTEEWCFYLQGKLVGVGYADRLPHSMSAIYFFYDPEMRPRSLGTYNVMCLLRECARAGLEHLYLGYYVAGCRSLEYKATFTPNQVLDAAGKWRGFRM
jgi:arginine-tRNA-protein transferase